MNQVTASSPRRALFWSFAERYAGLLVSIGSMMVLSRLLTPAQVGIYSLCAMVTTVAGILRDFGVSEYLIQERELTQQKLRAAQGLAIIIAWTIGSVIFGCRDLIADYYDENQLSKVLAVLALNFLILPITSPTFALLNRELAFKQIFYLQLLCNTVQALTSITLAFLGYGVMSLAWGPVANVATQSVFLIWVRPRDCLLLPSLREARTVLRFGMMYVASRTLEVLTRSFHEPIIAKQFGFESVGLFSRALGLVELFNVTVAAAVVRVATPAFAAAHHADLPLKDSYARATAIFTSLSWTFLGTIAVLAEPLIQLMFGQQWTPAAPIAIVLALAALPYATFALAPQMLSATGNVGRRLRATLWYCPVHLFGLLAAAQFSLVAIASVWFFSNFVLLTLYMRHLGAVLGIRLRDIAGPILMSGVCAIACSVAQLITLHILSILAGTQVTPMFIAPTLLAGALSWITVSRALRHPAYAEISRIVKLASRPRVPRSSV